MHASDEHGCAQIRQRRTTALEPQMNTDKRRYGDGNTTVQRGRLRAGTAKVEITPTAGIAMCGYGARTQGAEGIHDPLLARVAVLSDGRTSLAIVSADLVYLYSERVVTEARRKWGVDHVITMGTHTHSGPVLDASGWYSGMEDKVIAAIGEAAADLFPARIGMGSGPVDGECFGYNRRAVGPDGKVSMWWSNRDRKPMGPTDPVVRVIRIDDERGKPRAVLANYACHPVTLGQENLFISADFPGPMAARVEGELGAGCVAMFLQGAGGDVHPYDAVMSGPEGFRCVERNGVSLGSTVLDIVRRIGPPAETPGAIIKVADRVLRFPFREDAAKTAEAGVMAALIGDIALAVIPYEPFVQHQIDLLKRSPFRKTLFLGYAYFGKGDWLDSYLPTKQAAREGGYGAAVGSANVLEVGAGERMVDAAVEMIESLRGVDARRA